MLMKEFCQATGLSKDTVRFYVSRGLLRPHVGPQQSNRYQVFDGTHVERARLIKSAQRLGFSLREIAGLAKAYEALGLTRERKAEALRAQLDALDDRAAEIRAVRGYLAAKLRWIERGETGAPPSMKRIPARKAPARPSVTSAADPPSRRPGHSR